MSNFVSITIFWLVMLFKCVTSNSVSNFRYDKVAIDSIFNENITYMELALSDVDCGRRCSNDPLCVTFDFSDLDRSCRGHSVKVDSGITIIPQVGSSLFQQGKNFDGNFVMCTQRNFSALE